MTINSQIKYFGYIKNYRELGFNDRKRASDVVVFSVIGAVTFTVMAIIAMLNENYLLGSALFMFGITTIGFVFLIRTKGFYPSQAAIFVIFGIAGHLYLLISGAHENTGYLWCFTFCPIMYTFLGYQKGFLVNIFLAIASITYFWGIPESWQVAIYPSNIQTRFVYVYLCLTFLLFIQEFSRAESDKQYQALSKTLELKAHIDPLTRILNRRGMKATLENFRLKNLLEASDGALMVIDVDLFKKVNDQFGHSVGDDILKAVVNSLKENIRRDDTVSRWGGEEFLILLDNVPLTSAKLVAEKIRLGIEDCQKINDLIGRRITVSIGISFWTETSSIEHWIELSDKRMFMAKEQGRNRVVNEG